MFITVEEAKTNETKLDVGEGMLFEREFVSPYLVINPEEMIVELDEPLIVIYEKRSSSRNSKRWRCDCSNRLLIAKPLKLTCVPARGVDLPQHKCRCCQPKEMQENTIVGPDDGATIRNEGF